MFIKSVACITLLCFISTLWGCYNKEQVSKPEGPQTQEYDIVELVMRDGSLVTFMEVGGKGGEIRDSLVVGVVEGNRPVKIPLSNVQRIYVQKLDVARTIFAIIGIPVLVAGVVAAIVMLTKKSCPFVYSYDGKKYVFEGEPYGGAICEGLTRADWCRLDHLADVSGEYRLLLTNEVDETQFTDEFKLWIVDHAPGLGVCPDAEGNLYSIGERIKPSRAVDGKGNDVSRWIAENDRLYWESNLSLKNPESTADLRDTILLLFPKPHGVTQAKFLVNGGTTMWGSQMLKRMTELRGESVAGWFDGLKDPANRELLDLWNKREELYKMQVRVQSAGQWVSRGLLWGGGPYVTEDRVVSLDLRGVEGDTIRILLTPPAGFWQLNSFAMDYSRSAAPRYQEISATSIIGHDGSDLRAVLSSTDGKCYMAPEIGQKATLMFPAPPLKAGLERTVFAKVSGYYDLRAEASGPAKVEILNRLMLEPGFSVRFAMQEFAKWRSEIIGAKRDAKESAR